MDSSNVLMIGPDRPCKNDFGAKHVADLEEARDYVARHRPAVLVLDFADPKNALDEFLGYLNEITIEARWILVDHGYAPSRLVHFRNDRQMHGVIDSLDDPDLEEQLRQALESYDEARQHRNLTELFSEQSLTLKRLSADLEQRVQRRHKALRKSLKALEDTKVRMQAYHRALLGIHRATTVKQMERSLVDAMNEAITLAWVRVHFDPQGAAKDGAESHVLTIELPESFEALRGEVQFAKADGHAFAAEETDFLFELSEALGLALGRLRKLEQAEMLKRQWQATFDSIPHALCLVGHDTEILKLNRAFADHLGADFRGLLGKCCFETFFGPRFQAPVPLDPPFTFRHARVGLNGTDHFEVIGQKLGLSREELDVRLILLRVITEEVRFERRILDSSKLAELGTIGSSIAHEINNPLGGMLSFLQLILMDLPKDHALFADVKAMEQAVFRCRDIVLNLLSFARKQDLGDFAPTDLGAIVARAVKLIELQSKSAGIVVDVRTLPAAAVRASAGALVQALSNILSNAIDAIEARMRLDQKFHGKIEIALASESETRWQIRVVDNGDGIRPEVETQIFNPLFTTRDPKHHSGMGLTTAFTILNEHHGRVELHSTPGQQTAAVISLDKLDATKC